MPPLSVPTSRAPRAVKPLSDPRAGIGFFRVREAEQPSPISLLLRGGMAALAEPEFRTEARGGSYTPLGSAEALLTVNAIARGQTEFQFSWCAVDMRPDYCEVDGADLDFRPEGLVALFELLQARARTCVVEVPGGFARRGVVRTVVAKPTRGYLVDPSTGNEGSGGVDVDASITFEWAGPAISDGAPSSYVTGEESAGEIGDAVDALASAAADDSLFKPSFFEQIDGAILNVRGAASDLRSNLKRVGSIVQAPAAAALAISATARSFGNVLRDLETLLCDTPDLYQAAGQSLADVVGAKRATGEIKGATFGAMIALAKIFDALDARKPRSVPVRPGQSLADVAAAQLGNPDRWTEIAELNGFGGQFVPEATYSVDVPGG